MLNGIEQARKLVHTCPGMGAEVAGEDVEKAPW